MASKFDLISKDYATLSVHDPSKEFVQRPMSLELLGDCKGKIILDVGCGEGILTRQVAEKGAKVIGYDPSSDQIRLAQEEEDRDQRGIEYILSNSLQIKKILKERRLSWKFDKALSCLVLLYADNNQELRNIFQSTYDLLKQGGEFVSITFNPEFQRFNTKLYRRIFEKQDRMIIINFLDSEDRITCKAPATFFSKQEYEAAALNNGFSKVSWVPLKIAHEGLKKMSVDYWKRYEEDCPYIGFVATK